MDAKSGTGTTKNVSLAQPTLSSTKTTPVFPSVINASRDSDSDVATTAEDATNKTLDVTARAEDDNSDEWSDVTTSDDDDDRCVVA